MIPYLSAFARGNLSFIAKKKDPHKAGLKNGYVIIII